MGSQAKPFVKAYGGIVSEGRDDQAGLVQFDGLLDELRCEDSVLLVKVTERFVEEEKLEGLAQGAKQCDALPLSEGKSADFFSAEFGHPRFFQHVLDRESLGVCLGDKFDIFLGGELGEQLEFLKKKANSFSTKILPLARIPLAYDMPVEQSIPVVVIPPAVEDVQQGTFPVA